MKKSVEILGLPVISITEGRELGMSKTLLIDAKNGIVAAITIEDEDWYRGVKLIPYESVIAIGDDAVTITHSENILKLDDAGDYETLLDENIRVIGTKAITKNGTIQGKITELFIGEDGKIEKCEITAPDGTTSEVTADQISIFGKQVTVIDPEAEKKTEFIGSKQSGTAAEIPAEPSTFAPEPAAASFSEPVGSAAESPIEEISPEVPLMNAQESAPEVAGIAEEHSETPIVEADSIPEMPAEQPAEVETTPEMVTESAVEVTESDAGAVTPGEVAAPDVPSMSTPVEEPQQAEPVAAPTVEELTGQIELPMTSEEPAEQVEMPQELESSMTPEPSVDTPVETPEVPAVEEPAAPVEEVTPEPIVEQVETPIEPPVETPEVPAVEEPAAPVEEVTPEPVAEPVETPVETPEVPAVEEPAAPVEEVTPEPIVEQVETPIEPPVETPEVPAVEEPAAPVEPAAEPEEIQPDTQKMTQQAEALRAALKKAMSNQAKSKAAAKAKPEAAPSPVDEQKKQAADKAMEERQRRFLLGKKATRTIKTDKGILIVESGADITEEVLQKAKLANKFIELSMSVQ